MVGEGLQCRAVAVVEALDQLRQLLEGPSAGHHPDPVHPLPGHCRGARAKARTHGVPAGRRVEHVDIQPRARRPVDVHERQSTDTS